MSRCPEPRNVRVLGCGGLGAVIQIANRYAVKLVADAQAAEDEVAILEILGSTATTIGFYGRLACCERAALLLELCQRSLHDALQSFPGQRLANPAGLTAQQDVVMMLNCVAQLHGRGVIHQDVKPSNFLLGQDGAIKLCDFNLSRLASDSARINGGTVLYFSPHMLRNMDEAYAADWWALGVTLYQVLHGLHSWPFSSCSLRRLDRLPAEEQLATVRQAVLKGHLRFRPLSNLPRAARTLIRGLLHPIPEKRWGLLQVLAGDYPSEQAFSAVALRYPQLRSDMERLLALHRLCRQAPLPRHLCWSPPGEGSEDDTRPSPARSCRSLRALSSCLLQRVLNRKHMTPATSRTDDVSQRDQLSYTRCPFGSATGAVATNTAAASPAYSPIVGLKSIAASSQTPAASPPLYGRYANLTEPSGGWLRQRNTAASACAKVCATRRFLVPRSDGAVRAAAQQAAAVAPRVLLTDDGRLAQAAFVPCEVRAHEVDVDVLNEALAALNLGVVSGRKRASDDAGAAAAADNGGGQVQGIEVLEQMRIVFERRRLTVACSGSGRSGAGDLRMRAGAGLSASQTIGQTALRPLLPILSGSAPMLDPSAVAVVGAPRGPAAGHPLGLRECSHAKRRSSGGSSVGGSAAAAFRGAISRRALRGRELLPAFDAAAEVGSLQRRSPGGRKEAHSLGCSEGTHGTTADTVVCQSDERSECVADGSVCGGHDRTAPPAAETRLCPLRRPGPGPHRGSPAGTPPQVGHGALAPTHVTGRPAGRATRFRKAASAGKPDSERAGLPLKLTRSASTLASPCVEPACSPCLARLASTCSDRGCGGSDGAESLFSLPLSTVVSEAPEPEPSGLSSLRPAPPPLMAATAPHCPHSNAACTNVGHPPDAQARVRARVRAGAVRLPSVSAGLNTASGACTGPRRGALYGGAALQRSRDEERSSWGSGRGDTSCQLSGLDSSGWRRCCPARGREEAPSGPAGGCIGPMSAVSGPAPPEVPPAAQSRCVGAAGCKGSGWGDVQATCAVGIAEGGALGLGPPKATVLADGKGCDLGASGDHLAEQPRREGFGVWDAFREAYGMQGPRAWAAMAGRMLSKTRSASATSALKG